MFKFGFLCRSFDKEKDRAARDKTPLILQSFYNRCYCAVNICNQIAKARVTCSH